MQKKCKNVKNVKSTKYKSTKIKNHLSASYQYKKQNRVNAKDQKIQKIVKNVKTQKNVKNAKMQKKQKNNRARFQYLSTCDFILKSRLQCEENSSSASPSECFHVLRLCNTRVVSQSITKFIITGYFLSITDKAYPITDKVSPITDIFYLLQFWSTLETKFYMFGCSEYFQNK